MALDTSTARSDIAKIYIAAFNRAPDAGGLDFWTKAYMGGTSLSKIAEGFASSQEFTNKLTPNAVTNSEYVAKIYLNVFGRTVDSAGSAFWTAALDSGKVTKAGLLNELVAAAGANGSNDGAMLANKAAVGVVYATSSVGSSITQEAAIASVTADSATKDAAIAAINAVANTVTLTSGNDNVAGYVFDAPQTYNPGGSDRINSLQDNDKLTGTGTADTLNTTIGFNADTGDTTITPVLTNVETVNVKFDNTGYNLDMQDSTGTTAVNIERMNENALNGVLNMNSIPTTLSIKSSAAQATEVNFDFTDAAAAGTTDATTLKLMGANVATVKVEASTAEGVETITVNSSVSANTMGKLQAEDIKTLTITGDKNLTLGSTAVVKSVATTGIEEATLFVDGLANAAGSLTKIDASTFTGNLSLTVGGEINAEKDGTSGDNVAMSIVSGSGNDTFRIATDTISGTAGYVDTIDGGEGTNTIVVSGNTTINAATSANVKNIQALEIRSGHDTAALADTITIDANAFDKLTSIYIRNEGNDGVVTGAGASNAESMTATLNNLTSAHANGITIAHSTTGNSTIANNTVNVNLKTSTGSSDTASITIIDGVNTNPVFNAQIAAAAVEGVTITDSDTESNTLHITTTGRTQAGSSLTLKGGAASQYMNLDSTPGIAGIGAVAGTVGYGYNTDGTSGSSTTAVAAAAAIAGVPTTVSTSQRDNAVSTVFNGNNTTELNKILSETIDASSYVGNVVVRLGDLTRSDGFKSQSITTSTGSDTFIFDNIGAANAGFTSADTITASTGTDTLIIDGDTSAMPTTPGITHQASEWDNLKGIDVLRYANNAGTTNVGNAAQVALGGDGYYAVIDNEFVDQTDAGDRLTIINNDGRIDTSGESDLVLNVRALSQTNFVTFVGANGVGTAGISSNRIIVSDASANQNMILNGGDTDVRTSTTAGYTAGNNNVFDVYNTADVSISDLSQTSNFGRIEFHNDQATAQTLTLTLSDAVIGQMVDTSNTSTTAGGETLVITAVDGAAISNVNLDASLATSTYHTINFTGSTAGNDTVRGTSGNDTIALTGGTDTVIFNASGATNGNDTITGITAGAGAGDVLNFEAFLSTAATAVTTAAGVLDGVEAATTANVAANNTIVGYDGGGGLTTTAIAALFKTTDSAGNNVFQMANSGKAVIIEGDDDAGATTVSVYFVDATLDGTVTNVTATDVVLVATINATDIDTFVAANFTVA